MAYLDQRGFTTEGRIMDDGSKYVSSATRKPTEKTDIRNTLNLETVHCPKCMAVPEYCPGHVFRERVVQERNNRGTMVPQPLLGRRMSGNGGVGQFSGNPVTRWLGDGERMVLLEPFSYTDKSFKVWTASKGSILDGASIPRPFWSLVGSPYRGKYRYASIVHDYYCVARSETWKAVHRMFYDACLCGGCTVTHAKLLFYAVYHFGPRWGSDPESMRITHGANNVTSSDVAIVRGFIEGEDPDFRRMIETIPRSIGIVRGYGRRGIGSGVPPVLSPKEDGDA